MLSSKRSRVALRRIFALHRPAEAAAFESELANRRLLFHGSRRANWLGILSRGLMLPRSVLRRAGTRTDAGMLGAGASSVPAITRSDVVHCILFRFLLAAS